MPELIDFDVAPPTHSTWGPPQGGWRVVAPGIYSCSTASHGGYWLSPARLAAMPADIRAQSWNGTSPWFEEDCDVLLVVRAFPDLFSDEMRDYAEKDRLSRILMATREAARQARLAAWRLSGRDVASLIAAGQDLAGETGYDAAGRVYDSGFMEVCENGWLINIGNSSRICETLSEAETYLWHGYASEEIRQAESAVS